MGFGALRICVVGKRNPFTLVPYGIACGTRAMGFLLASKKNLWSSKKEPYNPRAIEACM